MRLLNPLLFTSLIAAAQVHHRDGIHRLPKATASSSTSPNSVITAFPIAVAFFPQIHRRDSITTSVCDPGYTLCAKSVGGGCCPDGYGCASDLCTATTRGPTTCYGTAGAYACPGSLGGGCCLVGEICAGLNNCRTAASSSTPSTVSKYSATPTTITTTSTPSTTATSASSSKNDFTTGAIIGISVGAVAAIILSVLAFMVVRSLRDVNHAVRRASAKKPTSTYAAIPDARNHTLLFPESIDNVAIAAAVGRPPGRKEKRGGRGQEDVGPAALPLMGHRRGESDEIGESPAVLFRLPGSPGMGEYEVVPTQGQDVHLPQRTLAPWFHQPGVQGSMMGHGRTFSGASNVSAFMGSPPFISPELGPIPEGEIGTVPVLAMNDIYEMPVDNNPGPSVNVTRDVPANVGVREYGSLAFGPHPGVGSPNLQKKPDDEHQIE